MKSENILESSLENIFQWNALNFVRPAIQPAHEKVEKSRAVSKKYC